MAPVLGAFTVHYPANSAVTGFDLTGLPAKADGLPVDEDFSDLGDKAHGSPVSARATMMRTTTNTRKWSITMRNMNVPLI